MERSAGSHDPQDLDQQRKAMLAALEEAVLNDDYEFATQIGTGQDFISPADLIEYMDVKRRGAEDPVEQRRWGEGIHNFCSTLDGQEFTSDEVERLEAVKKRMEFDGIVSNEEEADVTSIDEAEEKPDWEEDEFYMDLRDEQVETIGGNAVFQHAEQTATGIVPGKARQTRNLDDALKIIDKVRGPLQQRMRMLLDWHVFEEAVEKATGIVPGRARQPSDLHRAIEIIESFASDSEEPGEVTNRMRLALDKHVFEKAEQTATGIMPGKARQMPNLDKALEIVKTYASSPDRARAMLHQLGFM